MIDEKTISINDIELVEKLTEEDKYDMKKKSNSLSIRKTSEMKISEAVYHPYKLGLKGLDKHFSSFGGIIPSQATFLTAPSGMGKTTLALHIAKCVGKYLLDYREENNIPDEQEIEEYSDGSFRCLGPPLFISLEMSDMQIKLYEKRMGELTNIEVISDDVEGTYVDWIEEIIDTKNPSLLILDSLQYAGDLAKQRGLEGSKAKHEMDIINLIKEYSHSMFVPVIVIGHTNKDGSYKGNTSIKHALDFHLTMEYSKDTNEKIIASEKNRFGSTDSKLIFNDNNGISITDTALDEESLIKVDNINNVLPKYHQENWLDGSFLDVAFSKLFFNSLLLTLKDKYKEDIESSKNYDVDFSISSIKNIYSNRGEFSTNIDTKNIQIGFDVFKDFNNLESEEGYFNEYEKTFMNNICKTKNDKFLWMYFREFEYIFETRRNNSFEFYQRVLNRIMENSYLLSTNQ